MSGDLGISRMMQSTISNRNDSLENKLIQQTKTDRANATVITKQFAGAGVKIRQGQQSPDQVANHTKNTWYQKAGAVGLGCIGAVVGGVAGAVAGTAGTVLSTVTGLLGGAYQGAKAASKVGKNGVGTFFAGLGGLVAGAIGGALGGLTSGVQHGVSLTVTGFLAPIAAGLDVCRDGLVETKNQMERARADLGSPSENSVMNTKIKFTLKAGDSLVQEGTVKDAMFALHEHLGGDKRIDRNQMMQYIHMGEKIAKQIESQGDDYQGGPIKVGDHTIKPNLESTRALSWYMQAKGVADNNKATGATRPIAMMAKGSMVVKDPNGKLFKFLKSSNNTYGRASTHFNERSGSGKANFKNTGLAGMLAGKINKQGAQYGIEDYGGKMPSGGGCLLFDRLNPLPGKPDELFMKWETKGMPSFYGKGTHADDSSGWAKKIINRHKAQYRCLGHSLNFLKGSHKAGSLEARRETLKKGIPQKTFDKFNALMDQMKMGNARNVEEVGETDALKKAAKKWGLFEMSVMLERLEQKVEGFSDQQTDAWLSQIRDLKDEVDSLEMNLGADLDIRRKGAEIQAEMPVGPNQAV
ncbi:MAG: hypothetical protein AAFX06_09305 [Planctomycetota bacterium]